MWDRSREQTRADITDWMLIAPILTSCGYPYAPELRTSKSDGMWSNLPASATLEELVEYARRRHAIEPFHEEAKGELGWDQYQGRLWPGFHRHAVAVMPAFEFSETGSPTRPFFPLCRIVGVERCLRCIERLRRRRLTLVNWLRHQAVE